jgi:hypothetical protein
MKSECIMVCFCTTVCKYYTYFTIFNFQENTYAEHLILFIFLAKYIYKNVYIQLTSLVQIHR